MASRNPKAREAENQGGASATPTGHKLRPGVASVLHGCFCFPSSWVGRSFVMCLLIILAMI